MKQSCSTQPRRRRGPPLPLFLGPAGSVLLTLAVVVFSALGVPETSLAQPAPLGGLDAYVEEAMEEWGVPGLALAIVKDDRIVYARGFGVRELGSPDPVDEHTLFAIGSTSKAFTSASLAALVDGGQLHWDDRVTDHLPGFQMYDPAVTRELTLRDLLTHRSGLARGDAVWYMWPHGRDELLRRIRYLEPTRSFRSAWQYQNLMFLTAGQVVAKVSGVSWDEFVQRRFFDPLGMDRTVTSTDALSGMDNVATPHAPIDGEVIPILHRNIDNVGPAGSIYSSVSQMAQWVRMHLAGGSFNGQRLLSDSVVAEMHSPQMLIQKDAPENALHAAAAKMNFNGYGLAWWVFDYRGHKVVDHGGGIDGMRAHVALLPEENLGMVALSNGRPNNLIVALMYRVFDHYLGGPDVDWSAEMLAELRAQEKVAAEAAARIEEGRLEGTSPSLPLEDYVGTYRNQYYGDVQVTHEGAYLRWSHGAPFQGTAEHWHNDTFRIAWDRKQDGTAMVRFIVGPDGRVASVSFEELGEFRRVTGG